MKRMLLVFAHPDDESFVTGGAAAKYAKNGWHIELLCATRGEAGDRGLYQEATNETLGHIRAKELESATGLLGIVKVTHLGFTDGALSRVAAGELEEAVFKKLRSLTPDVVITFEPGGITNHPDHVRLTRATAYAFQKYLDVKEIVQAKNISAANPPRHPRDRWQVSFAESIHDRRSPKLYFACLPQSIHEYLLKIKAYPELSFGKPWSTTEDKLITTVVDVGAFIKKKEYALKTHVSQRDDVERFLTIRNNPLISHEYFILRMHGKYEVYMGKNDGLADRL